MRKTLNINLGGMAFVIDENAFELLHNYLEVLKRKFNNEAERAEIMNDIESRIAELLNQRLQNRKEVIGYEDVQFVTDAMGKPEDIAGEENETAEPTGKTTQAGSSSTTTSSTSAAEPVKKRLFRDPDDAKVGGVISGLCHYFGIEDPVWARIIAVILIFPTSGSLILIYFLLLVIVPKAQSAAEKLQMKGEPVNINTIEKEIKEAATRAGESVQSFVKDQNIFERLWDATLAILRIFVKFFAVIDIGVCMILLMVVTVLFFSLYVAGSSSYSAATQMLVDSRPLIRFFSLGCLLFIAAPLIALIYLGLKILLGQRSRMRWLKWALFVGWFAGVIILGFSSLKLYNTVRTSGTQNFETVLMQPARGTLYAQLTDTTGKKVSKDWEDYMSENFHMNAFGQVFVNGVDFNDLDKISLGKPSLQLMASENDSFYIQEIINALGSNKNDAAKNAQMVVYAFSQTDTVLNLPVDYYINKTSKWRAQNMKIRIAIPNGKQLRFADNIDLWAATVKGDANYDDTYFANTTWTVEGGKVKCIAGENHKNAEEENAKKSESQMDKVEKKMKKVEEKLDKLDKKEKEGNQDKEDKEDKDGDKDF